MIADRMLVLVSFVMVVQSSRMSTKPIVPPRK